MFEQSEDWPQELRKAANQKHIPNINYKIFRSYLGQKPIYSACCEPVHAKGSLDWDCKQIHSRLSNCSLDRLADLIYDRRE